MSLSEKLEAARVALGKRKERERELLAAQAQQAQAQPLPVPAKAEPWKPAPARPAAAGGGGNKLLAGHLAHEFLAHGTFLGRRIEPSRGATAPAPAPAQAEPDPKRRYAEVSWLLMASGAHVPGVVNPTQLGRWLQIKD
ncbi:unnamed protein product [Miscanthus lutarioriparius]|uniref:Uncharacterized protein n=1 Tax=Miscanthus lutarioriparius TaxID=422564 RepID=A0A811QME2_9POAL|nr:unnamed protein product [Miscanthus lutarioriparius]